MPALAQEAFAVPRIAESFGASSPSCGEGAREVAEFQAVLDFAAADELMDEAGVETTIFMR